jgi:hypothetical protein
MSRAVRKVTRVPSGKVKVTMNLKATLVRRAKISAIVRRLTFGALVEKALQAQLARARSSAA